MRWAAGRRTSREEDIAYCLMGIFDINMPLLYGEGAKAFQRLQEEILRESEDHTLFAWRATPESAARFPYRGLLADSPDEFVGSEGLVSFQVLRLSGQTNAIVTNRGISLTSTVEPGWESLDMTSNGIKVGLNCRYGDSFTEVYGIELTSRGGGLVDQYVRSDPSHIFTLSPLEQQHTFYVAKTLHSRELPQMPEAKRQYAIYIDRKNDWIEVVATHGSGVRFSPSLNLIELGPWASSAWARGNVDRKAGLELAVPGASNRVLVLFWAEYDAAQRSWTYTVDGLGARPGEVAAKFAAAEQPSWGTRQKRQYDSLLIPHAPRRYVRVTGEMGKIQGFDMFWVTLRIYQDERNPSSLDRVKIGLRHPRRFFQYLLYRLSAKEVRP
ncbi:hypothetical protein F5X99DRAFT_399448 [Biscogniauxia marginata]|nr:hypothetical protein F5X99DRAFT_399448 [Biscogniauxia marginata]